MMLYTKNGSFPSEKTDGSSGWVEISQPPEIPVGKELAWLNFQWVVRDPKPEDRYGYQWNWNHDQKIWIEYPLTGFHDTAQANTTSDIGVLNV